MRKFEREKSQVRRHGDCYRCRSSITACLKKTGRWTAQSSPVYHVQVFRQRQSSTSDGRWPIIVAGYFIDPLATVTIGPPRLASIPRRRHRKRKYSTLKCVISAVVGCVRRPRQLTDDGEIRCSLSWSVDWTTARWQRTLV